MRTLLVVALAVGTSVGCFRHSPAPPVASNKASSARPIVVDDELAFLPGDSDVALGIDLVRLRQSALFQSLEPSLISSYEHRMRDLKKCGIDPLRGIVHVTLGGKQTGGVAHAVSVVRGIDGARARSCVEQAAAQPNTGITLDGAFATMKLDNGSIAVATLLNPTTLIFEIGPGASRTTLEQVLRAGAPLRGSAAFMALYEQRERGASAWFMVNGNSEVMGQISSQGVKAKAIAGSVTVTDKLAAIVRISFGTDAEATNLVQMATPMLPSGQAMLERLDVRAEGRIAVFELVATENQVQMLAGLLGGMIP